MMTTPATIDCVKQQVKKLSFYTKVIPYYITNSYRLLTTTEMQLWKIAVVWFALKTKEAMAYVSGSGREGEGEGNLRICCFSKLQPKAVEGLNKTSTYSNLLFPHSKFLMGIFVSTGGWWRWWWRWCVHPSIGLDTRTQGYSTRYCCRSNRP